MEFSVPMALVDYIPVICFALGAILLIGDLHKKMSAASFALFAAGVIDIICAGGLKATYKLLYALNVCDFQPLNAMFFPVQSIGFLLAGIGVLLMVFTKKKALLGAVAVPTVFKGTFVFVGLMVAGLGILDAVLCWICNKLKKNWVMILFIVSFIGCLGMGYLSSKDFTDGIMNWIAEGVNVVAQGTFLIGVWQLHKAGLAKMEL